MSQSPDGGGGGGGGGETLFINSSHSRQGGRPCSLTPLTPDGGGPVY